MQNKTILIILSMLILTLGIVTASLVNFSSDTKLLKLDTKKICDKIKLETKIDLEKEEYKVCKDNTKEINIDTNLIKKNDRTKIIRIRNE